MIKKFLHIEHLGCLRNLTWEKGLGEAGRLVGVFAENGQGKTTLVAALRAARAGMDAPLLERRSLPVEGSPVVDLLTDEGRVSFYAGVWNGTIPAVEVFDRAFVAESVYDGRSAGPDQREQLFRLALGAGEVDAARAFNEAKKALAEAERPRREIEKRLTARCAEAGFSFDELRRLVPLADAPPGHAEAEARLAALEARQDLRGLPGIATLPSVPNVDGDGLRRLLDQGAAALSAEVVGAVQAHIAAHLDAGGEAWLRQGVAYAERSPTCPFCGQDLAASDLAALLPRFFDDSYRRLQEQLARAGERLAPWDAWVAGLRATERANQRAIAAWMALVPLGEAPEIGDLPERAEVVVALLRALVRDKQARLLEPLGADPRLAELLETHRALREPIERYDTWARAAAERCRRLLADHQGEVQRLRAIVRVVRGRLLRGSATIAGDLEALDRASATSTTLHGALQKAEAELKRREGARTETFLALVNEVLCDFGAGFRLRDLVGKPSSSRITADFQIALVDGGEDLDGARVRASAARPGEPRFDTVLSEGDRLTLALAVFFAHCLDAPDPTRVAILDDPFTSLDRARRAWTAHYIERLAQSCSQVWVLSHDEFFLRDALPGDATFLCLQHGPDGSTLERWDPNEACKGTYLRRFDDLIAFRDNTTEAPRADDAWRSLRQLLEGYLRLRFPQAWRPGEWLGTFIRKAREGDPDIHLAPAQVDRIAIWCRLSNPAMHGDPHDAGPVPSPAELRAITAGVLEFVQS